MPFCFSTGENVGVDRRCFEMHRKEQRVTFFSPWRQIWGKLAMFKIHGKDQERPRTRTARVSIRAGRNVIILSAHTM